ncbi:MAG: type II secretion system protein GspM [Pseudomonadota bacterium]
MARSAPSNGPFDSPLTPLLSRLAAIGLLVVVILAILVLFAQPLQKSYAEVDSAIEEAELLKAKFEGIAASRKALEKQLKTLRRRQGESGFYLEGSTDALAGAALQEKVTNIVESADGQLRSVQSLPVGTDNGFEKVGVRVQMITNVETLFRVLYELEAGETFLFVENLDIRNQRARRRNNENAGPPDLAVRFDLSGFLRPEAG